MHKGGVGGGFRPPPQAGEKCIEGMEKREKKKKGENRAKIGKIRFKIEKEGKIESIKFG